MCRPVSAAVSRFIAFCRSRQVFLLPPTGVPVVADRADPVGRRSVALVSPSNRDRDHHVRELYTYRDAPRTTGRWSRIRISLLCMRIVCFFLFGLLLLYLIFYCCDNAVVVIIISSCR